ncbi:PH domain-containing protein [Streptomonospora salina]|uniref:Membrane protein YdbS with pleckstrin-like domain n=1 Tax=Streptomonospora salina TaxID=104205 RepID=A0A841EAC1_9ACTN|nr:PH domain-containing protein [Streptomonospora salina]MBB5998013.1 membrane protein YdbS with pleckstrin-like domain [Streptomonospora salina]
MSAAGSPGARGSRTARIDAAFAAPEGTSWSRVCAPLTWYRRTVLLAALVPALVLVGTALWFAAWWWVPVWAVLVAAAAAAGWWATGAAREAWGYAEGATDLYLTYGLVTRQLVVIPYGRMQVVDVTSDLLEQALGLATVQVRTAATTADTRIPGLRLDDAVQLRDRLAARSETFSTGL